MTLDITMTLDQHIQMILRMLPEGNWEINEQSELVGPVSSINCNTTITVESDDPVQTRLYEKFLLELLNSIPDILKNLDDERLKTAGLFKELNRVKEARKQSYAKGVSDSYRRLTDVEVRTPTARDALLEASGRVLELLHEDK